MHRYRNVAGTTKGAVPWEQPPFVAWLVEGFLDSLEDRRDAHTAADAERDETVATARPFEVV